MQSLRINLFAAGVVLVGSAALAVGQATVPVPKFTGPIAVTADSYPLAAANRTQMKEDLSAKGYVEEEFLVSGTANVYDWSADGKVSVKTPNAPYTTRILVRRPADASKFSGNVIFENLENTRSYDWTFIWAHAGDSFMEHGDAYVAMTHTPQAVAALKKFNPTRYAAVSFANPNPSEACGTGKNATSDSEEGLQYDMMSQVAALLKSDVANKPLAGFRVENIYAGSHTGELITYINAVLPRAKLANGKAPFDGFVSKTNTAPTRINRCSAAPTNKDPRAVIKNAGVPVIRIVPEGDVADTVALRRDDSDAAGDRFRLYEVPGSSHMDWYFYHNMPVTDDQVKAGQPPFVAAWPLAYACTPEGPVPDWPALKHTVTAAFRNLDEWVRKGVAPPKAPRLQLDAKGETVTDKYGNAVGGVPVPYLVVPAATYHPHTQGPAICRNVGYAEPFDWARMQELYGSQQGYLTKFNEAVDKLVKDRWLTESDGKALKATAAAAPTVPLGRPAGN